jgi:hypothetical protein
VLVLVTVVLVAAAAAFFLVIRGTLGSSSPSSRQLHAAIGPPPPSVPVVVLNATSTQGAAASLARSLRAERVAVSQVGNVTETRPPGMEILYAPGERVQAERLARLLRSRSPTVAPINPVIAGAAGSGARLVVVIE